MTEIEVEVIIMKEFSASPTRCKYLLYFYVYCVYLFITVQYI